MQRTAIQYEIDVTFTLERSTGYRRPINIDRLV